MTLCVMLTGSPTGSAHLLRELLQTQRELEEQKAAYEELHVKYCEDREKSAGAEAEMESKVAELEAFMYEVRG